MGGKKKRKVRGEGGRKGMLQKLAQGSARGKAGFGCTVSTIRAILVPFHGILCCYDIPPYIVTLAILVSSLRYRR